MKPVGYDAHITPIDGCCADKCKEFLDGSYRRGCYVTIDRVLEIIDKMPNANTSYWNERDVVDREGIREEILALKESEQE